MWLFYCFIVLLLVVLVVMGTVINDSFLCFVGIIVISGKNVLKSAGM